MHFYHIDNLFKLGVVFCVDLLNRYRGPKNPHSILIDEGCDTLQCGLCAMGG